MLFRSCHHSQNPPHVSVHSRETCFPCTVSTFKPRIDSNTVARGTALWESLVGKPQARATDPLIQTKGSVTLLQQLGRKNARACPHSRRVLTPLGRLQKYPKIHVSTGEECSGSSTHSTPGLRPRHRQERNPERPPSNSHGDWHFLRPPGRSLRSPS